MRACFVVTVLAITVAAGAASAGTTIRWVEVATSSTDYGTGPVAVYPGQSFYVRLSVVVDTAGPHWWKATRYRLVGLMEFRCIATRERPADKHPYLATIEGQVPLNAAPGVYDLEVMATFDPCIAGPGHADFYWYDSRYTLEGAVTVLPMPAVALGADRVLTCTDPFATLTASVTGGEPSCTYLWSPGGETSPSITVAAAGAYSVLVTCRDGMTCSDSVLVEADTGAPVVDAGPDQTLEAEGASVVLRASAQGGTTPYSYLWSPGGETTESILATAPGVYTVSVAGANGCVSSDSAIVLEESGGSPSSDATCPDATRACDIEAQTKLAELQEAVDSAPALGRVAIPAGLYCGALAIARPIKLLADPCATLDGTLVIDFGPSAMAAGDTQPCATCTGGGIATQAAQTLIDGLTIRGSVVIRNAGLVRLAGMTVRGSPSDGVSVVNASVDISDSAIAACVGAAIRASEGSHVTTSGNTYEANGQGSVAAPGSKIEDSASAPSSTISGPDEAGGVVPDAQPSDSAADSCPELGLASWLEDESLGEPFESTDKSPRLMLSLSARADVEVTARIAAEGFPVCTKQVFAGPLEPGEHAVDLRPVLGDFIPPDQGEVQLLTTATASDGCVARSSCIGLFAPGSIAQILDIFAPYRPTAPGQRIDLKLGGSITLNGSSPYYVTHGYPTYDSICVVASCTWFGFEFYIDGVRMSPRPYSVPVEHDGLRVGLLCHWLTELPANSLAAGEHVFRGVWTDQLGGSNSETEVLVTVEYAGT